MKTLRTACLIGFLPAMVFAQSATPDTTAAQPIQPILTKDHSGPGRIGARIEYDKKTGLPHIAALIQGGPASDFGFHIGDVIVKIDRNYTSTLTPDQVSLALHGEPGSAVELTIQRDDDPKLIVRSLERRTLSVDAQDMVNPPFSQVGKPDMTTYPWL